MRCAGIVNQYVDPTEFFLCPCEHCFDGAGIANIAGFGQDADSPTRQFPNGFLQQGLVATSDDQIATFRRQSVGDGEADTAIAAGDERDSSVQASFRSSTGHTRTGFGSPGTRERNNYTPLAR